MLVSGIFRTNKNTALDMASVKARDALDFLDGRSVCSGFRSHGFVKTGYRKSITR